MTAGVHALQRHVAVVDHALPRILLPVLVRARVELALVLLIVLFAQRNLPLAFLLPLLNCGRARIASLLLLRGLLHHEVVDLCLQLVLLLRRLPNNLFLLFG